MGHKIVCLSCQIAFSATTTYCQQPDVKCPACGEAAVRYPHRFRPPMRLDTAKWQVVRFLYQHGFLYQHVYLDTGKSSAGNCSSNYATYSQSMREAVEFVNLYGSQARNLMEK